MYEAKDVDGSDCVEFSLDEVRLLPFAVLN